MSAVKTDQTKSAPRKRKSQARLTVTTVYAENCDSKTISAIVEELARLLETRPKA